LNFIDRLIWFWNPFHLHFIFILFDFLFAFYFQKCFDPSLSYVSLVPYKKGISPSHSRISHNLEYNSFFSRSSLPLEETIIFSQKISPPIGNSTSLFPHTKLILKRGSNQILPHSSLKILNKGFFYQKKG